jgi:hypothetical protein
MKYNVLLFVSIALSIPLLHAMEQNKNDTTDHFLRLPDPIITDILLPWFLEPKNFENFQEKYDPIQDEKDKCDLEALKAFFRFAMISKRFHKLAHDYFEKQIEFKTIDDIVALKNKLFKQSSIYDKCKLPPVELTNKARSRFFVRTVLLDIIDLSNTMPFVYAPRKSRIYYTILLLKFMHKHNFDINETFDDMLIHDNALSTIERFGFRSDDPRLCPFTPLMRACFAGNIKTVKLLLFAGADSMVSEKTEIGPHSLRTPLEWVNEYLKNRSKDRYIIYENSLREIKRILEKEAARLKDLKKKKKKEKSQEKRGSRKCLIQ